MDKLSLSSSFIDVLLNKVSVEALVYLSAFGSCKSSRNAELIFRPLPVALGTCDLSLALANLTPYGLDQSRPGEVVTAAHIDNSSRPRFFLNPVFLNMESFHLPKFSHSLREKQSLRL